MTLQDTSTPLADAPSAQPSLAGPFVRALIRRLGGAIDQGRLTFHFPDGRVEELGGRHAGPEATVHLHDLRCIRRLMSGGFLGMAEGYLAAEWSSPDLLALFDLGAANDAALTARLRAIAPLRWMNRAWHWRRANSRRGSQRNIAYHYDLGNAFYRLWLDRTLSYSSGLFEGPGLDLTCDLENAQRAKFDRLAEMLDLKPGMEVLEIGCGWGGLACHLASEWNCRVTGITISREQFKHARALVAERGLADRVEILFQDYRDLSGSFDRVVSVEMFEAVGQANWPVFFQILRDRLRAGGRAALQVITVPDDIFPNYQRETDFIQRYIFPGGMLPSPEALTSESGKVGLTLKESFFFRRSYAETLRRWDRQFQKAWPNIEELGFDDRFKRMWEYYLNYCAAGFEQGIIDVGHFRFDRA